MSTSISRSICPSRPLASHQSLPLPPVVLQTCIPDLIFVYCKQLLIRHDMYMFPYLITIWYDLLPPIHPLLAKLPLVLVKSGY